MKKIFQYLTTILLAALVASCFRTGGEIQGKVLDLETKEPVEGVFVVVTWSGSGSFMAETHVVCTHVESQFTDKQGSFKTESWVDRYSSYIPELFPFVHVYKPGYIQYDPETYGQVIDVPKDTYYVYKFRGNKKERLERLRRELSRITCSGGGKTKRQYYPMLKALYFEFKSLIDDPATNKDLLPFRYAAAYAAMGFDTSHQITDEDNEAIEKIIREDLQ